MTEDTDPTRPEPAADAAHPAAPPGPDAASADGPAEPPAPAASSAAGGAARG
ncbi:MAG: hypothetical protein IRZ08_13185, partial [Frankia sp.]|nr:hypothetical protein [Frankia sp.]